MEGRGVIWEMKPAIHLLLILLASGTLLQAQAQDAPNQFFRIDGGTLEEAIEQLGIQLNAQNLELPNVIMEPEAEQATVPAMRLYRVGPADALQLIATSAGFGMEPIMSIEPGKEPIVVGYRVFDVNKDRIARFGPATPVEAPLPGVPAAPATTLLPPSPAIKLPTPAEAFNQLGGPFLVGPGGVPQPFDVLITPPNISVAGAGGVGMMTPNATILKVYPLGITQITAKEFEALLRDMLRQAELDTLQDKTRLMFHEQSRILMANAPDQVHQIIAQLLEALARNQQADLLQRLPGPIVVP